MAAPLIWALVWAFLVFAPDVLSDVMVYLTGLSLCLVSAALVGGRLSKPRRDVVKVAVEPKPPLPSAASRVFAITELAEAIFLDLTAPEIFVNQRVCKDWQRSTLASRALQQVLFFEPISTENTLNCLGPDEFVKSFNPYVGSPVIRNPLIDYFENGRPTWLDPYLEKERPGVYRPEASWRKQLVSQLPIESMYLVRYGNLLNVQKKSDAEPHEAAVRLGEMAECLGEGPGKWRDNAWYAGWKQIVYDPWRTWKARDILAVLKLTVFPRSWLR